MPQAAAATASISIERRELPIAGRECELRDFTRADAAAGADGPLATAQIVFSAGAAVRRYDWYRERYYNEVLVVEPGAIRLDRLKRGISLLDTHDNWRLASVLGICDQPTIGDGKAECRATFSRRDEVAGVVRDVADGVIRHVSVGYVRHKVQMVAPKEETGTWVYRVTEWEPYENSLVPIPADMDSQVVRSGGPQRPEGAPADAQLRTFACEFEEQHQPTAGDPAATSTRKDITMADPVAAAVIEPAPVQRTAAQQQPQQPAASDAAAQVQAERQRSADITALCARHGLAAKAGDFITSGKTVDQVRAAVLDDIATRSEAQGNGQRNVHVQTLGDEGVQLRAGIEEALQHRVDPRAKLTDAGRQFRGMSLMEIGRDLLARHHVDTRGFSRMEVAQKILHFRSGMHSTSDFASLLANVANKRLRDGYMGAKPTYTVWARRAPNAPDFKAMSVVQLSTAPDLLQVNEHGEFKYGSLTDGKETYSMLTYGRIVALTRQAIVNDDLRGFDRLVTAFGDSAARLENRTAYAVLTANAALGDGVTLFHATHGNLAGAGGAIALATLNAGRTAMRLQKGLGNEELNIGPAYLIAPATQEMVAYQFTSNNYVPEVQTTINEFARGGRSALEVVIDSVLDANSTTAWYLAASSGSVDTVEYCFLDGNEGPVIESEVGFEIDGVSYKCREDFAAKAIDHRGLYKNAGA